jgi:hypothetical protein
MDHKAYAAVLAGLAFAFFLRVLGQALVATSAVSYLPPMEEWFSGFIPYPALLPAQVVILILQTKIVWDIWRGSGVFASKSPTAGRHLRWISYAYFAVMVLRYVLVMAFYPERRWFSIPIFFHWVLAAYLLVLGRYHLGHTPAPGLRQA